MYQALASVLFMGPLSGFSTHTWRTTATDEGPPNYDPQAKSNLPPVFVNKILLEHNYVYLFTY